MKIGILGSGSWGTGLSIVLNELDHDVMVYGRNKNTIDKILDTRFNEKHLPGVYIDEKIKFSTNCNVAIEGKDIIIIAISSQSVRELLKTCSSNIKKDQIIVNVSKGIEIDSLKTISEIVKEYLPDNEYVVLSGPSHAEEVAKKLPTTLVAACNNIKIAKLIQHEFSCSYLRIYTNPDVLGVELGGSLKNIIALGAGISDGLGFGDNSKAALMTRGIKEIAQLSEQLGADQATFKGLSGIGDLIVTCTSMHSRNRRCGILIGKGYSVDDAIKEIGMVVEGIYTIKSAYNLAKKMNVSVPITEELYKVVYENENPKKSVSRLMERKKKDEMEDNINW